MSTTRPGALSISSARAGRFAGQAISPRTPSSRASAHFRTDSMLREPLLASSDANYEFDTSSEEALSSAVNGTRTLAGQGFTPSTIRALLLGSLITAFALALSVLHLYSKNVEQISDVSVTHNSSMTLAHIISYENYTVFPLQPEQYLAECRALTGNFMPNTGYWTTPSMGIADVVHPLDDGRTDVCLSTITYMLDGRVGLMADLALVAQTAAMAREQNRTFFIDDTYWNRGRWTDHFADVRKTQPGPQPGCSKPPAEELVACPRLARHWVVNSRTARYHLGHGFSGFYENAYGHQLNRLKPIFEMAQQSFLQAILPNNDTMEIIQGARQQLNTWLPLGYDAYISVHIRRGDKKPRWPAYPDNRIPVTDYSMAAEQGWYRLVSNNSSPAIYFASDSSQAMADFRTTSSWRSTIFSLWDTKYSRYASSQEYSQSEFAAYGSEETRIQATRGMIVDFALLSGAWASDSNIRPSAIVCAISSAVCKLAAVVMGWDKAFGEIDQVEGKIDKHQAGWIEVDIKGRTLPEWQAFDLF